MERTFERKAQVKTSFSYLDTGDIFLYRDKCCMKLTSSSYYRFDDKFVVSAVYSSPEVVIGEAVFSFKFPEVEEETEEGDEQ